MRASRRRSRALVALSVTAALMAAGCGSSGGSSSDTTAASSGGAATTAASGGAATTAAGGGGTATTAAGGGAADLSALYDACKAEGQVNLIALPDDVGQLQGHPAVASATSTRASRHPVASPDASSQEELDAIKNLAGQHDMPDSVDVSPAKAQDAIDEGYCRAVQADRSSDEIPDGLKDPDQQLGRGLLRHHVDRHQHDDREERAEDVRRPEEARVQGPGRPQRRSAQGRRGVRRRDGRVARQRRQRRRHHAGHPVLRRPEEARATSSPTNVTEADRALGRDADRARLELQLPGAARPQLEDAGFTVRGRLPDRRRVRRLLRPGRRQGLAAPERARKLWIEHILSDEGALGYLQGGAMPARFAAARQAPARSPPTLTEEPARRPT